MARKKKAEQDPETPVAKTPVKKTALVKKKKELPQPIATEISMEVDAEVNLIAEDIPPLTEAQSNGQLIETPSEAKEEKKEEEKKEEGKEEIKEAAAPAIASDEKDNVAFLNEKIDKLISLKEEKNYSDFWFYVKELNTMIFSLRGVPRQDRLKFKDRIGELCEEAKKVQDEIKATVSKTSKIKLEHIQKMLEEALTFGKTPDELEKSFVRIEEANKFFREGIVKAEDGEESADMSRHDREAAKELIKKFRDQIFDRKREIRDANFKIVTDRLTKITEEFLERQPRRVFDAIKKLREEMRGMALDRSQWKGIDEVIDITWKKALEKVNAGREYDSKKKINEFDFNIRRKEEFITTLEKEIKELDLKWKNVKNDFFKNRVNEWMAEKKEKIEHTRKEIGSLKERAQFMKEKMERK